MDQQEKKVTKPDRMTNDSAVGRILLQQVEIMRLQLELLDAHGAARQGHFRRVESRMQEIPGTEPVRQTPASPDEEQVRSRSAEKASMDK
ncbi:MAG: hypothetical protein C4530_24550, partial [Desulfobacteraceae bacterium]